MGSIKTEKKPEERYRQVVEFAKALPPEAALSAVSVSAFCLDTNQDATKEILEGAQADVKGTTAEYMVKGGLPGHRYRITLAADLSTGEKIAEDVELQIEGPKPDPSQLPIPVEKQMSTATAGAGKEFTPEVLGLAQDAREQKKKGKNPPNWAVDEDLWEKSKKAAAKTYDETDDAFWPVVVSIYKKMGGSTRAKKSETESVKKGFQQETDALTGALSDELPAPSGVKDNRDHSMQPGFETPPTDQDRAFGRDAQADFELGVDPPAWAQNAEVWMQAKDEAKKHHSETSPEYWGTVVAVYRNIGGKVNIVRFDKAVSADLEKKLDAAVISGFGPDHYVTFANPESQEIVVETFKKDPEGMTHSHAQLVPYELSGDKVLLGKAEDIPQEELLALDKGDDLGFSSDELHEAVRMAVQERYGMDTYIERLYPDSSYAIVRRHASMNARSYGPGAGLWKVEYEVDAEGGVSLVGDWVPVKQTYEEVEKRLVSYLAEPEPDGSHRILTEDGEGELLAKALTDSGVAESAREAGEKKILFKAADPKAIGKTLQVKVAIEEECEKAGTKETPRRFPERVRAINSLKKSLDIFVPFIKDEEGLKEKGIAYGVAYAPGVVDKQGDWMTAEDIEEAAHDYMIKSRVIKRQHEEDTENAVVESYIAPCDFYVGSTQIKKGSWVMATKLCEEDRERVKNKTLTGFSLGGTLQVAEIE